MRIAVFLVASLFMATAIQAAEIEGRVLDNQQQPVADAQVSLSREGQTTTTDASGRFSFTGLSQGSHRLSIITPGGQSYSQRVSTGDGVTDINLSSVLLEHLEVRSNPLGRNAIESVQPVSLFTDEELSQIVAPSLGETLDQQPGLSSTAFGQGAGRPVIRGLTGSRIRILEDGIGALDASTVSDDHAVSVEPLLADSIEVVRGPGTLLYGQGSIGGVVNVVDNRIPESAGGLPLEGAAELRLNSVADGHAAVARLDGSADAFAWHVDAFDRDDEDYDIPGDAFEDGDNFLENSFVRNQGGSVGGSHVGQRGFIGVSVSRYEALYGVPGHGHVHGHEEEEHDEEDHEEGHDEDDHGEEEESVSIDLEQTRYDLKGELREPFAGAESLRIRAGYNDYQHIELEGEEQGTVFDNEALEARTELKFSPWGEWLSVAGLQYRDRDFAAVGEEAFVPPSVTDSLGVFFLTERPVGDWRFELGGRYDTAEVDVRSLDTSRDFDGTSLSAGANWGFSDRATLAFNIAHVTQFPTAEQLFAFGPHLATETFEVGDANLDDETALTTDVSLRLTPGPFYGSVSLYRNDFSDFIYLDETGTEDEGLPVRVWSQAGAEFVGAEAELGYLLSTDAGEWDFRLWGDTVDAELDSGENLPRITPSRLGLDIGWSRNHWSAGVEYVRVDDQTDTAPDEAATEGYGLLNADLRYDIIGSRMEWSVFVRARNLTDEVARNHTSFLKEQAPQPGRNFIVGARVLF